jgi:hypothetical protein
MSIGGLSLVCEKADLAALSENEVLREISEVAVSRSSDVSCTSGDGDISDRRRIITSSSSDGADVSDGEGIMRALLEAASGSGMACRGCVVRKKKSRLGWVPTSSLPSGHGANTVHGRFKKLVKREEIIADWFAELHRTDGG